MGDGVRRGLVRCGLAAVLFGSTVPVAARLVHRTSAPMLAVLPFTAGRGPRATIRGLRRGGRRLAVPVVAGGLLGPLLLVAGLSRTPAPTASLLLNLELVATAAIAALVLREHVGARVGLGIVLVTGAGVTLVWSATPRLRLGALLIAAACACWGLDNAVTAKLDTLTPDEITLAKGLLAGATNVLIAFAVGGTLPAVAVVAGAVAVGAIGYGASITLWIGGARELGATRGQLVFATAPFVGVVVAWTLFGSAVTGPQIAALCLAGLGAGLVVGSGHEHGHAHAPVDHVHEHSQDPHHTHEHDPQGGAEPHSHRHAHVPLTHAHPHLPDLHHRHPHTDDPA